MLIVLALFAAIASVGSCTGPAIVEVEPPVESGPMLEGGAYSLVIRDVNGLSCGEAVRARDLIGAQVPVELLAGPDGRASLRMEGWVLDGEQGPGRLVVEGAPEAYSTSDDVDVVTEERRPVCMDAPEPEVEETEPRGPWAAVDLLVIEPRLAEGILLMSVDGCEMDLAVALKPAEDSEPPVVVEPEDGAPGQEDPGHPGEEEESGHDGEGGCVPDECP
jgi:hypothetical protein